MKYNYVSYEIHYPSTEPAKEGKYFAKTPDFEQAVNAARSISGCLYGITADGQKISIWY